MSKTIVGVSDSNDPTMIDYVEKQLQAIVNSFTDVEMQHVNETDPIMERHARYPGRLPAYFILKNGARMATLQAKVSDQELLTWFEERSG
jgi:hypothetical protein